jgi:hypothetical protein
MDDKNDLGCRVVDICHDLVDERACDALLEPRVSHRRRPDRLEVGGQPAEHRRVDSRRSSRRLVGGDLALHFVDAGERPVPARFELACDQPVGRIGSVILPESAVGGIARRFKIAPERIADLIPLLARLPGGVARDGNGARSDHAKQRLLDGVVDTQTSKSDARRTAVVHPDTRAAVARNAVLGARVSKCQLAPTTPAPEQAGQ